jgi:FlaG/FlaF family flagellin (archaellin)
LVFIVVALVLFIVITQILAIPLWWIFGQYHLSTIGLPTLVLQVSPNNPSQNENITVTVTNSSLPFPVENANVTVQQDGTKMTLHTNSNGQTFFEYLGDITIVNAQKSGFQDSNYVSIPQAPAPWVEGAVLSLGTSIVSGFVSGLAVVFASDKFKRQRKRH